MTCRQGSAGPGGVAAFGTELSRRTCTGKKGVGVVRSGKVPTHFGFRGCGAPWRHSWTSLAATATYQSGCPRPAAASTGLSQCGRPVSRLAGLHRRHDSLPRQVRATTVRGFAASPPFGETPARRDLIGPPCGACGSCSRGLPTRDAPWSCGCPRSATIPHSGQQAPRNCANVQVRGHGLHLATRSKPLMRFSVGGAFLRRCQPDTSG